MKSRASLVLLVLLAAIAAHGQTAVFTSYDVSFGDAPVGAEVSQKLTLENKGSALLNIYSLDPSPNPPFRIQLNPCNWFVAAKKKCTFTIYFAPTEPGTVTGTLVLSSNASNGTPCTVNSVQAWCQTVNLCGTGVSNTALSPDPSVLSFVNFSPTAIRKTQC